MSAIPGFDNPILYAQFSARGGWRRIFTLMVAFFAVVGGVIAFTAYESENRRETLDGWLVALLAIQSLLLVIFGTSRVSAAVRTDMNDRMIESHRLMPMSRETAIVGYLLGAPIQVVALGLVVVVLGLILCPLTHSVESTRWLVANAMIASLAVMLWAIGAQIAFTVRGGVLIMGVGSLLLLANAGAAFAMIPAAALLLDPIVGHSVFRLDTSPADVWTVYGLPLIGQAVIAGICMSAASRKYRSADGVGLNTGLGLMLLAAIVGISVAAIWNDTIFSPLYRSTFHDTERSRFSYAVVTTLIFSLVPLSAAARAHARRGRRGLTIIALVTLATVALNAVLLSVRPSIAPIIFDRPAVLATALIILANVVSLSAVCTWSLSIRPVSWPFVVTWLLLVWVAPLIVQTVVDTRRPTPTDARARVEMVSPLYALGSVWTEDPWLARTGIATQLGLTLIPLSLATIRLTTKRTIHGEPITA